MADIARLQALKIDVVLDFRTQAEKQSTEQQFANAFNWIADPVQVGNLSQDMVMPLLQNGTAQNSRQFMIDVYGDFPTLYQLQYKRFLTLAEQNKTMLYHCTAGKDRTGFASLLLLSALGVDQRVIIADYLASNRYVAASNAQMLAQIAKADLSPQVLEPFLLVDPAYIAASLQVIDDNYGGMMSYLHDVLNVDVECIRGNYLMPSSCV